MITQAEIHDLFREHADEPWIADAGYMIGLGFDTTVVRENLEYRYGDPALYPKFLSALEETSGLTVERDDSSKLSFRGTDGKITKAYRLSIEDTDASFNDELQCAYTETMTLRRPDDPAALVTGLPELRRVLASIIRSRIRDYDVSRITQDFVWDAYSMLQDGSYTRKAKRFFLTELASDGLIFKDGSDIYPDPELINSDELETVLPTLEITDTN